ncbi:hypothetical protein HMPREF9474_01198 [ [[Clostridium] symbiosum WAL-14163]|uniref:Uncharacterized protein n=1 Tax=Clostridium symbiosum (strain WAL-14163) TaxID=742740 RepID=E7GJV5_CLOS6|nr:hypothetical protein HMPREF9474_01198 [ [[Clostridium] symbiosum WAL-14163]
MLLLYPVSEAFLQAVQENTRRFFWTGRITTKAGAVHVFGNEDIVKGSGYISGQCCGSTEIEIGTVYAAEMGITLFSEIDRYTLEDAKVELFYHLRLGNGSFEEVPMGIFEVSEANRTLHCLEIKAYDYMLRFERNFNGFETVGNAYAFLALCCKACDVELAHTQAEIEAMPNGAELLSVYMENDIETYRDVLFYVGQVLGGFFCINREGKLELRKYGNVPVMTVSQRQRFSSSFSDFITRYTAISSTNVKTQTAEYYALETDDGLTMNLGVNPLLQFGLEETRKALLENILSDLSIIRYVPFDSDTIGNPALDMGDVLVFSGGHADETQLACVTGYQIKINGKHSLKCVGKNPRMAQAKSKNDKNLSGLLNQIEAGKIGIHTFTNASAYTLNETDVKIISIEFAAAEETHVQFFAIVLVDVTANAVIQAGTAKGTVVIPVPSVDEAGTETTVNVSVEAELPVTVPADGRAVARVMYVFNDEEILTHYPAETWGSGKHVLPLYYPIEELIPNFTNTFQVFLRLEGGSGQIDTGGCIASISGQGMAAAPAWDGKIVLEDTAAVFRVGTGLSVREFAETVGIETMELVQRQMADSMGRIPVGAFGCPVDLS